MAVGQPSYQAVERRGHFPKLVGGVNGHRACSWVASSPVATPGGVDQGSLDALHAANQGPQPHPNDSPGKQMVDLGNHEPGDQGRGE